MAIVVYPDEGWNSFVSLADATDGITSLGGGNEWIALTADEQDIMLVTSAVVLASVATPSDSCDFAQAQVLLLQFDLQNGGSFLSFTQAQVAEYSKAKVGPLEVEYNLAQFSSGVGSGAAGLPPVIASLLSDCLVSGGMRAEGFQIV